MKGLNLHAVAKVKAPFEEQQEGKVPDVEEPT